MAVYLQKTPGGVNRWICDFTWAAPDGKKRRIRRACLTEKQKPAKSETAAEAYEQRIRVQLAAGTFEAPGAEELALAEAALTFAGFRERYFAEHVAKLKGSSRAAHETLWRLHLVPVVGSVALAGIAEEHVARVAAAMRRLGRGPKTINTALSALNTALTLAKEWGLRGPPPKVRWEKVPDAKIEYFAGDDVAKIVAVGDAMATVAVKTGLRLGELLSLRWSDVDLGKRQINVSKSTWWNKGAPHEGATKTGRIRMVTLPDSALAALKAHKPKGALATQHVFTDAKGGALSKGETKWRLWAVCTQADLPRCGWHKLRHSYISALVSANVPLPQVQKLAGHARIEQTLRYTHVNDAELHAAALRLD